MFERFSGSARSVVFRGRDHAASENREHIEIRHILLALIDLHPELFAELGNHSINIQEIRSELELSPKPLDVHSALIRLRFSGDSKRLMYSATEEAQLCWKQWTTTPRGDGSPQPEDLRYWESRLRQTIHITRRPGRFFRWILRRTWEVDERHILLGLLTNGESPEAKVLTKRGISVEIARRQLCSESSDPGRGL